MMQDGIQAMRTAGSVLLLTPILAHLASAQLALERVDEALAALDEGLTCIERDGERWAEAELHRIRGQVFRMREATPAQAEACLRKALDVARGQNAKSYELRAATALASHWQQQRRTGEARALLSEAIGSWPPDLDNADLRDRADSSRHSANSRRSSASMTSASVR